MHTGGVLDRHSKQEIFLETNPIAKAITTSPLLTTIFSTTLLMRPNMGLMKHAPILLVMLSDLLLLSMTFSKRHLLREIKFSTRGNNMVPMGINIFY
jgi:hypothetical protein